VTSLTIIVGSRHDEGDERACLDALAPQVGGIEVLLVRDIDTGRPVPDWVSLTTGGGDVVPELWATGLRAARGEVVALTATTILTGPDWVQATLDLHARGHVAVGGPIEPGPSMSPVDWAVYCCRYAPYARPVGPGGVLDVAGDNASYRRDVLMAHAGGYGTAFLEPFVHEALRAGGHAVTVVNERVVRVAGGHRLGPFLRQRVRHGRDHGRRRSLGVSRTMVLVGIATAPAVPFVMTLRSGRAVFAKRRWRGRFLATAPLVLACFTAWAAGEAAGRLDALRGQPTTT